MSFGVRESAGKNYFSAKIHRCLCVLERRECEITKNIPGHFMKCPSIMESILQIYSLQIILSDLTFKKLVFAIYS